MVDTRSIHPVSVITAFALAACTHDVSLTRSDAGEIALSPDDGTDVMPSSDCTGTIDEVQSHVPMAGIAGGCPSISSAIPSVSPCGMTGASTVFRASCGTFYVMYGGCTLDRVACVYDASTGALVGVAESTDNPRYCGNTSSCIQAGVIPEGIQCTHDGLLVVRGAGTDDGTCALTGIPDPVCGTNVPCCPEDLNQTESQNSPTIAYPSAILRDLDGQFAGGGATEFDATWAGVTQLSPAVVQDCAARFVTDPPSNPCMADTVIEIGRSGMPPARVLVGMPAGELASISAGTSIHVRQSGHDAATTDFSQIEIARTDGAPLVVVASLILQSEWYQHVPQPEFHFGGFTVTRSALPSCVATPLSNCRRVYESDDLVVTVDGVTHAIHATESQILATSSGRYRVTNRAVIRRNEPAGWVSCSDGRPDRWSFEIVRLGDG